MNKVYNIYTQRTARALTKRGVFYMKKVASAIIALITALCILLTVGLTIFILISSGSLLNAALVLSVGAVLIASLLVAQMRRIRKS